MTPLDYYTVRKKLGLTQADLALQLGLPREAIGRREAGTQRISEDAAIALRAISSDLQPVCLDLITALEGVLWCDFDSKSGAWKVIRFERMRRAKDAVAKAKERMKLNQLSS